MITSSSWKFVPPLRYWDTDTEYQVQGVTSTVSVSSLICASSSLDISDAASVITCTAFYIKPRILFKFSYSRFQCFGKHNNHGGLNSSLEMSLLTLLDIYTFVQIPVFWCFGGVSNHGTCKKKSAPLFIVHLPQKLAALDWTKTAVVFCRMCQERCSKVFDKILFALDILVWNSRKKRVLLSGLSYWR